MGSKQHNLKSDGSGIGKVISGGRVGRLLGENVIVRDSKSSGNHQYDKYGK